jgi:hypothetical protein
MLRCGLVVVGIHLVTVLFPLVGMATPVLIAVGTIESVGGDQSFCPSNGLQQAIVRTLSRNSAYTVQVASQPVQTGIKVTGKANCSLGLRQRQNDFLLFQQRSTITTATVQLQLQLVNASTGATIATIAQQGNAQAETETTLDGSVPIPAQPQAAILFEQAIAQALDAALPRVNAALTQTPL